MKISPWPLVLVAPPGVVVPSVSWPPWPSATAAWSQSPRHRNRTSVPSVVGRGGVLEGVDVMLLDVMLCYVISR